MELHLGSSKRQKQTWKRHWKTEHQCLMTRWLNIIHTPGWQQLIEVNTFYMYSSPKESWLMKKRLANTAMMPMFTFGPVVVYVVVWFKERSPVSQQCVCVSSWVSRWWFLARDIAFEFFKYILCLSELHQWRSIWLEHMMWSLRS